MDEGDKKVGRLFGVDVDAFVDGIADDAAAFLDGGAIFSGE